MHSILVIEDDLLIRETIESLLQMEGYRVRAASNGQEALSGLKCSANKPCMILLDLMMPIMNGIEFRQQQLLDPRIAEIPVVVMTGRADLDDVSELGIVDVLQKPFRMDTVLELAEEYCRQAPGAKGSLA